MNATATQTTLANMTVDKLREVLADKSIAPFVEGKYNSKTRKADLIKLAEYGLREFVESTPVEPAQGLNEDRSFKAANAERVAESKTEPLSFSEREKNYARQNKVTNPSKLDDGSHLTPAQVKRLIKKSRSLAARNVRVSGGYAHAERV
jgi:hypothetical protein